MGKSGVDLSEEFKGRAREFAELAHGLDDEQWQALCVAENWSVGTTAHHVGQSFGSTWGVAQAIMAGSVPPVTWDDINAMNAAHAAEFPNPDKAETLAMLEESAEAVAQAISELDDDALERSAVVAAFSPEPLPGSSKPDIRHPAGDQQRSPAGFSMRVVAPDSGAWRPACLSRLPEFDKRFSIGCVNQPALVLKCGRRAVARVDRRGVRQGCDPLDARS